MILLGLTGNIGCGKSTVSKILKERGIEIIDADLLSREIYNYDDVIYEMKCSFPEVFIDNEIDRTILGNIVFNDENRLKKLNFIAHKKIKELIDDKINKSKSAIVVIDAALLFEANIESQVNKVITVYCNKDIQIERIINRDNVSVEDAKKRIKSQLPQLEKIKKSDYVIDNSGSLDELQKNVEKLLKKIEIWNKEIGGN